jgi:hypothetical protein
MAERGGGRRDGAGASIMIDGLGGATSQFCRWHRFVEAKFKIRIKFNGKSCRAEDPGATSKSKL